MQIYLITVEYQRYDVTSMVKVKSPGTVSPPAIAVCFALSDITITKDDYKNLTVEQIFARFPKEDEIVSKLYRYKEDSFEIVKIPKKSPDIRVSRFIKQLCICYGFSLANNITIYSYHVRNSYESPSIFTVVLNTRRINNTFAYYYSYDPSIPFWGNSFTLVHQFLSEDGNKITLDYQAFERQRLPSPYTTHCYDYSKFHFDSEYHRFDECMINNSIAKFSKIPFAVLANRSYNYPLMNDIESNNDTFVSLYMALERKCANLNPGHDCKTNLYSHAVNSLKPDKRITISLYESRAPKITTIYLPAHDFIDYLTFILSYISFWLGFSPFGFLGIINQRFFANSDTLDRNRSIEFEHWARQIYQTKSHYFEIDQIDG